MKIIIRPIQRHDYGEVVTLKQNQWRTYEDINRFMETNPNNHTIIAEIEGQIAAIISYEIINLDNMDANNSEGYFIKKYSHLFETRNKICFLHSGITHLDFRKKGLARYLLYKVISDNISITDYFITNLLEKKDGTIPFLKMLNDYNFIHIGYEIAPWGNLFDGINKICHDCGPGSVCHCNSHVYYYDIKNNRAELISTLTKLIKELKLYSYIQGGI
jgi:hypothetical protein